MYKTRLFTESWAHYAHRPQNNARAERYWHQYHEHRDTDVSKLHAEYWSMVAAELQDRKHIRLFKVV